VRPNAMSTDASTTFSDINSFTIASCPLYDAQKSGVRP
jgi:hypothetical protein